ncbi:MAG: serine/threonine-protein kinase, partial [Vicinamibacterales bacterium]|nr:serine/threonine-protein kinase [Vicinamibacterales bacterium]
TVLVKVATEQVGPDAATRARFLKDAHAAAAVSHPNVATLFEVGDTADQLFLVFEFVSGETLDQAYEGALDIRRALELGIQLAEALGAAHAQGVRHLDVRPANIMVTMRGHAKLLDTGLSRWTTGGLAPASEESGPSPGEQGASDRAAPYRSPEQRRGESADHRSDLFSLGVILFKMLTGCVPGDGALSKRGSEPEPGQTPPSRPGAVNADVPEELDAIVVRALAERAEDRHQSAVPLAAELRSVAAILAVRSGDREPPSLRPRQPVQAKRGRIARWFGLSS